MKAKVLKAYTDRLDKSVHLEGETVELTAERSLELSAKGVVEPIPDAAPAPAADDAGDLGEMTVKELRAYIAAHGGAAPDRARKAELAEIARGL